MNIYTHKLERAVAYDKVPPGKRKPRRVEESEVLEVNLAVPEKEEEFPLAYTLYQNGHLIGSRYLEETPYRAVIDREDPSKFRLYTPCTCTKDEKLQTVHVGTDEFHSTISRAVVDNDYQQEIMSSIETFQWEHAIYDDILWEIAQEPVYTLEIGFQSLFLNIVGSKYCNRKEAYKFRADEKNLIIKKLKDIDERSQNFDDVDYWIKWLEKNHIEVGDVFCTTLQPYDMRVMEELTEEVHTEMKHSFGEHYLPDFQKAPGLQCLQNRLVSRIWNESAYRTNGYILYDEIYAEALAKEICALYNQPYEPND